MRVSTTRMRNPDLDRHEAIDSRRPQPRSRRCVHVLRPGQRPVRHGRLRFTHELVDIETLNRRAFEAELELTAVSIHAYAFLHDKYVLCTCGASMGDGYGPMVVVAKPMTTDELRG